MIPGRVLSCAAGESLRPASPMRMSQITTFSRPVNTTDGPIITPCTVTCVNLQTMHPLVQKRLDLRYRTYYTLICYAMNPTPNHLGAWVQLAGVGTVNPNGSREWIPANFFVINNLLYPN